MDKAADQPPARIRSRSVLLKEAHRIIYKPPKLNRRREKNSVRSSVFLEDVYKLGYMDSSEEEEEPQVHKGWLKMNPIAERKSA